LVVLIAALAVILAAVIGGTVLFIDRTLPPYQGAKDFLDAIVHGRRSAAEARLCSADREHAESAIENVRKTFGDRRAKIVVNPLSVDRSGERAIVEYTVDASGTRFDHTFKLEVRHENGEWKACPA
jgi:hypothetical protein